MNKFIHIRSPKFPILPEETEEMVNDGMYGKALALYLQERLKARGYDAPFICCEDWGWWVEVEGVPFAFGVCIYCGPRVEGVLDLFCTDGATARRQWSWRKFRVVDTTSWAARLHEDLVSIFSTDQDVELVNTSLDSPFSEDGRSKI
jgi:hypothetical protein